MTSIHIIWGNLQTETHMDRGKMTWRDAGRRRSSASQAERPGTDPFLQPSGGTNLGYTWIFKFYLHVWLRAYRICLQCRRSRFDPWDGKIPWRREWQPTAVFLPGDFHGRGAWWATVHGGHKDLDMPEWVTLSLLSLLGEFSVCRYIAFLPTASPFWKMEFFFLGNSSMFDRFIPMGLLCSPFEKKPLLGYTEQSYIL